MSSTSQHAHPHSISSASRASLPPSHNREYSSSHRPGSSMSISSMLGTDADLSRNRPSLPPPIPPPQSSPTTNGHNLSDNFRRDYAVGPPSRPYSSAHAGSQQFGPPLASASSQSPPYRPQHAESSSPTRPNYDYHRPNLPSHDAQRSGGQDTHPGRGVPSWQGYDVSQEARYANESRNTRVLEQKVSPHQSPVKPSYEREDSTYPFLPKTATSSFPPANIPRASIERPPVQRPYDSRSDRQSSSPELSRHHRENGLRSLQEIRRDSAGTPDPLSTPRSSPLLRRSFAVGAAGSEDGLDKRVTDILSDDRRGRASPLPQAVQGAQAQSKGPTNEPGIKNEFARMFSGIGSGVGSAVSTPVPQEAQLAHSAPLSPLDNDGRGTPLGIRGDPKARDSSRAAKRRRLKDDDIKHEEDASVSLARTLSGGVRGQKRTRNNYQNVSTPQSQSYHHNAVHHNHNHASDGTTLRKTTTPSQANPTHAPHNNYHHQHLSTKPAASNMNRKPLCLVNSQAVFERVKNKPRNHLGTMLYSSKIVEPTGYPRERAKLGYICIPNAIPKFEDKDNCTFTVRVSRTYLQKKAREEICERQYLWGAEIYTDDSDPIAVAIHSGWLRGEWDGAEDVSMLNIGDLGEATAKASELASRKEKTITISEIPRLPQLPVPGRDLHITLLLLPRLEKYGSVSSHGITSREWGKHDGVSFKIDKIAWVDEGLSRGEERGGAARRKRLRETMDLHQGLRPGTRISTAFRGDLDVTSDSAAKEPATKL